MRVTEKGQVTIPKPIRDRLGIGLGSEVEFVEQGADVVLKRWPGSGFGEPATFEEWVAGIAGTLDLEGLSTGEYMDWLRGPRDDLDSC